MVEKATSTALELDHPSGVDTESSLAARFEAIAQQFSDRPAMRRGALELSYDALNRAANRLAHELLDLGSVAEEPVALLLEDPLHYAVAQLATLKAGTACVPMDAAFPAARHAQILADSGANLLVTEAKHSARARELALAEIEIAVADELRDDLPESNPNRQIGPESLAYILYTSGSTGSPKGVMQTHRGLLQVARLYQQDLAIGPADRITSPTSLAYTGTIWALLSAMMCGAAFVCSRLDSPRAFVSALESEGVTVAQLIGTLLRQLMHGVDEPIDLARLRLVYTGGEALQKEDVRRFAEVFPKKCELLYDYGSTEAGIISHLPVDLRSARRGEFQQGANDPSFPVGYTVAGTEVMVLDEHGDPLPQGQDGEIAVRSRYLATGYWKDAELTKQRFPPSPDGGGDKIYRTGDRGRQRPDGCLLHLGRADFQVKVRGYRVQLEEIEAALRSLDEIAGAVARVTHDQQGKAQIIAYLARKGHSQLSIAELRRRLAAITPSYMIPARFIWLERIPAASGGKLDVGALPDPDGSRPEMDTAFVKPNSPRQELLCQLWSEVLNIEPVGVQDNFFELGGDSIAVFRLVGLIRSRMGLEIDPSTIFEAPNIEDLARALEPPD